MRTKEGIHKLIKEILDDKKNNSYASISQMQYKTSDLIFESKLNGNLKYSKLKKNEKIWFEDGAYYATKFSWLLKNGKIKDESSIKYILCEKLNQVDIDYEEDFLVAKQLYITRKIN